MVVWGSVCTTIRAVIYTAVCTVICTAACTVLYLLLSALLYVLLPVLLYVLLSVLIYVLLSVLIYVMSGLLYENLVPCWVMVTGAETGTVVSAVERFSVDGCVELTLAVVVSSHILPKLYHGKAETTPKGNPYDSWVFRPYPIAPNRWRLPC